MKDKAAELAQRAGITKQSSPVLYALVDYVATRPPIIAFEKDKRKLNALRQTLFRAMNDFSLAVDRLGQEGVTDADLVAVLTAGGDFPRWNAKAGRFEHTKEMWLEWFRPAATRLVLAAIAHKCGSLKASGPITTIQELREASLVTGSLFFQEVIWSYKRASVLKFNAEARTFIVRQHPPYDQVPTFWLFSFDEAGRITPVNVGLTLARACSKQRQLSKTTKL